MSEIKEEVQSVDSEYSSDEYSDDSDMESLSVKDSEDGKKKRGRKPKTKDQDEEEKVQKKRGRKPKAKDLNEEEKKPKKRGRKPKEKVYSVKELPKTFFEENKNETLILHLPIKLNDKEDKNNPQPSNDQNNQYLLFSDTVSSPTNVISSNMLPTQMNLMEKQVQKKTIQEEIQLFFDSSTDSSEVKEQNKQSTTEVVSFFPNSKENTQETYREDDSRHRITKKNLKNIMYEFINANNDKKWLENTNIYCWWCCHPFSNMPCSLPEYYKKDKFYVSGCYCSFNCAASYNFSKNDDSIWERYSLLNLMYKKIFNKKFVKIHLAPPRETLTIFGGYLSIEEFREYTLKNEKTFQVIKPPLISIIPKIEENVYASKTNGNKSSPLVNESILTKTQNNLKLKRNKPITNPNSTLQSFMDLKII